MASEEVIIIQDELSPDQTQASAYQSQASNIATGTAEESTETNCAAVLGLCVAVLILGTGFAYILATVDFGLIDVSGDSPGDSRAEDNAGGGLVGETDLPDTLEVEVPIPPKGGTNPARKKTRAPSTTEPSATKTTTAQTTGGPPIQTPPSGKTTRAESIKTPSKRKTTQAASTTTPPTTTTPKAMQEDKELICTVGADATMKRMYPDDGVCSYIYFTHIIVRGTLRPPFQKKGWLRFQQQMKALSKTGGGIAFDVRSLTVEALRITTARAELTKLAEENVKHYGLLNVIAQHQDLAQLLETAKANLHELKALQGGDAKLKTVLAVGLFDYSPSNAWETYKSLFKKAVEEYEADTVIAISSTGYLESEQNCVAVPPLAIKSPNPRFPSLERHGELVKESFQYSKPDVVVGISFELAILLYVLEYGTTIYDQIPYRKCKSTGIGDIEVLCGPPERRKSLPFGRVGHYLRGNDEHVYIGEEAESLDQKVEYIKSLGVRKKMSWLVFNVQLTTLREGLCVSRFFMLQKIRDALNSL